MKKPKIQSRFQLNKRTVANLDSKEMMAVRGGCELTQCVSGSAAYVSSTAVIITTVVHPLGYPIPCYVEPDTDPITDIR